MIQVAHIHCYNIATQSEEILYVTSGRHFYANNQAYLPLISQKLSYQEHLIGAGTIEGPATVGIGDLVLTNVDARLDKYTEGYAFDGRKIEVYLVADENQTITDSSTIYFTGLIKFVEPSFSKFTVHVRNQLEAINVAMTSAVFAGTNVGAGAAGGLEGTPNTVGGKVKPQIFGRCLSAEGAPINDFFLMYGFNYDTLGNPASLYAFYNVYVKGIAYFPTTDYATPSLLMAANIATGYYGTCLASGMMRLGSVPANNGSVVADVADAPETQCSAGQVIQRIFQRNLGYAAGVNYDAGGIASLDALNACPTGYQITDNSTVGSIVAKIAASIGAWVIPDSTTVFRFGRIDKIAAMQLDSAFASVLTVTQDLYDTSLEKVNTGDQSQNVPATSVQLNHTKNWKKQDSGSLADAVSQALRTFFSNDFRQATSTDASVIVAHPLAPTLSYDTYLNLPIAAPVVNGDFSVNLQGLSAGWQFGNNGAGNGSLTQSNGYLSMVPSNGTCFITQTITAPYGIQPGAWQLSFVIPVGYSITCNIAQDGIVLFNQVYGAQSNDQDIIVPFTMLGTGTQSITVTFTTVDAVTIAQLVGVNITQPITPLAPILAGLLNGNFNTALPSGWVFSGGGAAAELNSVLTITPSGSAGQIAQTISSPQILPGNWLFQVILKSGSSVIVTIQQGPTVLYTNTYVAGGTDVPILIPFGMLSTGTQSISVILATVNTVTAAKLANSCIMANQVSSNFGVVNNAQFATPLATPGNGWTFSPGAGGTYTQIAYGLALNPAGGTECAITQTLSIPSQIGIGTWQLLLTLVTGNCHVVIQQGNNVLFNTAVGLSNNFIPLTLSAFGANTLTITLSTFGSVPVTIAGVSVRKPSAGVGLLYANLINGDFGVALSGANWTFSNDAGGTGSYSLSIGRILMLPVTYPSQITQTLVLGAAIVAGNWSLNFTVYAKHYVEMYIYQGGVPLVQQRFMNNFNDVNASVPFTVGAVGDITITFRTVQASTALFGQISITTSDVNSLPVFADVQNGAFAVPIVNAATGWAFSNDIGGNGTYTQANGVFTILPSGAGTSKLQQSVIMQPGNWTFNGTVTTGTRTTITLSQSGVTLATTTTALSSIDTNLILPFTVPAGSTAQVVITVSTISSAVSCGISNVIVQQAQIGLLPQQEADRRLGILKTQMERYTFKLPIRYTMQVSCGKVLTLKSNRFQLNAGRDFLVCGKEDDHDNESIALDVWRDGTGA